MQDILFKLDNVIHNYAWGSKTAMNKIFKIKNANEQAQAEMWMGSHPNGCSKTSKGVLLSELIAQDPENILGFYTYQRFSELPYLLKILAVEKPLSIQVHPQLSKAKSGYDTENAMGLAVDAPNRNYRDSNHKPELVYAITTFRALNAFRPIMDIVDLFEQANVAVLANAVNKLKAHQTTAELQCFFERVMRLCGDDKAQALIQLFINLDKKATSSLAEEAFILVGELNAFYPEDIGLFAPLILNIVELQAEEAMYLNAEIPHAYLHGTAIELMASSDNVLRAGLTPKHIDVTELVANTKFESIKLTDLKLTPEVKTNIKIFNVPVDDFCFEVHQVTEKTYENKTRGAEILLCVDGEITLSSNDLELTLQTGESAFVCASAKQYKYQGYGRLIRAYN